MLKLFGSRRNETRNVCSGACRNKTGNYCSIFFFFAGQCYRNKTQHFIWLHSVPWFLQNCKDLVQTKFHQLLDAVFGAKNGKLLVSSYHSLYELFFFRRLAFEENLLLLLVGFSKKLHRSSSVEISFNFILVNCCL